MREVMKAIRFEIDGEEKDFRITKMNAFDGAYLMKIVTEKALPLLQEAVTRTENETAHHRGLPARASPCAYRANC